MKTTEHKIDGEIIVVWHPTPESAGYSMSYGGGGWMPGIYDSVEATILGAKACFEDEYEFVESIQKPVNHVLKGNRMITVEDFDRTEANQ